VIGLLRVVGSLLVQQLPPGLPPHLCVMTCIVLSVLWVSCVAYLTNGIVLIDRSPFSSCVAFVTHDEPRSCLYVPPC
jgi:hypothetical protein